MAQYIDKDALVVEIERLENKLYYEPENFKDVGAKMALDSLKSSLDTLEVKEAEKNIWKPADGNDMPEIDREVIALLSDGKVVFAHRPIQFTIVTHTTGKREKIEAMLYGKGGWNQPNIKWWLDLDLPKMEE